MWKSRVKGESGCTVYQVAMSAACPPSHQQEPLTTPPDEMTTLLRKKYLGESLEDE